MCNKAIVICGPAGSGKDVLANKLVKVLGSRAVKLKASDFLKMSVHLAYGLTLGYPDFKPLPPGTFDDMKDDYSDFFHDTPRNAYISFSESYMKTKMGKKFYGQRLVKTFQEVRENDSLKNILVTEGGFLEEVSVYVDTFSPENVLILEIARPDHSFAGDSRYYCGMELKTKYKDLSLSLILNDVSEQSFLDSSSALVERWLEKGTTYTDYEI